MNKQINYTLYTERLIASIFVVFIHLMFPGLFGIIIKNIARFAVPFFLMISGYYWKSALAVHSNCDLHKTIKRIVRMTGYSCFLYICFNIFICFLTGNTNTLYVSLTSWENLFLLIVFNYTTPYLGCGHLCYLLSLIYVYFFVFWVEKKNAWNLVYFYSIVSIFSIIILEIMSHLNSWSFQSYYFRNWLFMGIPFFALGRYIKENGYKYLGGGSKLLFLIYIALILCESFVFSDNFEFLASSILACILLIGIAIRNPDIKIFSKWGIEYSQWIYVYHYIFVIIFSSGIVTRYLKHALYFNIRWLLPLLVVFLTIGFCYLTSNFNKKIIYGKDN